MSGSWETKWWTAASDVAEAWAAQSQLDLQSEGQAQGDKIATGYLLTRPDYLALFRDPFLTPAD